VNGAAETMSPSYVREWQQIRRQRSNRDVGQPVVATGNTTQVPEFTQHAARRQQQQHGVNA